MDAGTGQATKKIAQAARINNYMRPYRDVATCMYDTGVDPFTKKLVGVATAMHDRKLQRALMQFFKPENYFAVREALTKAGRSELIGDGCDALIPAMPSQHALAARRRDANPTLNADYFHIVPAAAKPRAPTGRGCRPVPVRAQNSTVAAANGLNAGRETDSSR